MTGPHVVPNLGGVRIMRSCFFVVGFIAALGALTETNASEDDVARLARDVLDDSRPMAEREAIIRGNPGCSAELIAAVAEGLKSGGDAKEEYRRIPWIWRV